MVNRAEPIKKAEYTHQPSQDESREQYHQRVNEIDIGTVIYGLPDPRGVTPRRLWRRFSTWFDVWLNDGICRLKTPPITWIRLLGEKKAPILVARRPFDEWLTVPHVEIRGIVREWLLSKGFNLDNTPQYHGWHPIYLVWSQDDIDLDRILADLSIKQNGLVDGQWLFENIDVKYHPLIMQRLEWASIRTTSELYETNMVFLEDII